MTGHERKTERSNAGKIMRMFARKIEAQGFKRKKQSAWFAKEFGHIAHFVHVHKFTFGPCFRVHLGVRVLNDSFEAITLNGPDFTQGFDYSDDEGSLEPCAIRMYEFAQRDGKNWFERQDLALLTSTQSCLSEDARNLLEQAISGHENIKNIQHSRSLLGL